MPDPTETPSTLRMELNAALAEIHVNLGGFTALAGTPLTAASLAEVNAAIASRVQRRQLIRQILTDLDQLAADWEALLSDGYPTLAPIPVVETVFQELQAELAVLEAAIAQFHLGTPETVVFNPSTAVKD